uniref:LOV domain-containing protein n=1 Tax=Attheya septentrionalis TaxID=420275 RepID=A0A7S2URI2_9STRA|mmetsp:Transcript_6421/g.11429  ORF Transcript_6421/g.11429 Transcript_6421/m.11429 type:complete len:560 (+) Transcript_6421:159-1838(+)
MSDNDANVANAGGQKLLFAPRGNQYNEDFDISEVFADYFTTEFEDPLNAYTSSMANFSGGAASVALGQQQQQHEEEQQKNHHEQQQYDSTIQSNTGPQNNFPLATAPATTTNSAVILPTGRGIKTAWHTGAMPSLASSGTYQQSQGPQSFAPLGKKPKFVQEATTTSSLSTLPLAVPQQSQQQQTSTALPTGGSALSGRLGFTMTPGGQVNIPHRVQQQNPPPTAPPPSSSTSLAPVPVMSLPVGVGIRLGGIGGVVNPGQTTTGGGMQMTHTQWNNAPGGSKLAHVQHAPTPTQYNPVTGQYNMQWPGMPGGYGNESEVGMSETAIAERRQRNREHAKRSRVRKKFMLESLQEQVRALQKENVELRMIVQEKIPHHAQQIIDVCCTKSPLFEDDPQKGGTGDAKTPVELVNSDFSLITSLTSGQQNFVLSDPRLPDNPIVYASQGFYDLTGYSREQVLGRNCRFLQGPGTDPRSVDVIRTAIANGTDCTVCLLNYKADGTPFWNQFFIAALRDSENCIVNYVGVQCHVEPEAGASALEEKVNAVMPLQIKNGGDEEDE